MDVRVGLWGKLSVKELMLLKCGVGEDSWESLGLHGDPTSPFWRSPWDFFGRNDAKAETPVLWPPHGKCWLIGKNWCWEGLGAGGEGDDRGWDGWMALLTWWTWVWVTSGCWWWTGRPGVLRFMGSQRVGHDWATELNRMYSLETLIDLPFKICDFRFVELIWIIYLLYFSLPGLTLLYRLRMNTVLGNSSYT